jgi:hypothetical protein
MPKSPDTLFSLKSEYRNIFILDSIEWWDDTTYDPALDLVLTYDFGLKHKIQTMRGEVYYIDHLIDQATMQENNFLVTDFFKNWHYDANGNDIFTYQNIPFGFSFRMEIWNDLTSYARICLCLASLNNLSVETLYLGTHDTLISAILNKREITYTLCQKQTRLPTYYFPIAQWMDEKIRSTGLRGVLVRLREIVTAIYGYTIPIIDALIPRSKSQRALFIQEYHPTRKLIEILKKDPRLRIVLVNFTRGSKLLDHRFERLIPISGSLNTFSLTASKLLNTFKEDRHASLILTNGENITNDIYTIIEQRIASRITPVLRTLHSVIRYLDKYPIQLEILIANMGLTATLVDCVCKARGIPSYLIINGMLTREFMDEAKYATHINSYSPSIKEHYFRNMENIVCFGDPRMDNYPPLKTKKVINRSHPTITIGTSGFNPIDLNSYVAVEFEFMYDVLSALQKMINNHTPMEIMIKVRPNGYEKQYADFVSTFFPDLRVQLISTAPMKSILDKTDLYITIYSQTLFEASCLGIPAIYYKKDSEIMYPPFDGKSELVTVENIDDLVQALNDFQSDDTRYNAFLDRRIMEHYIGPLDGKNFQRNLSYIYRILNKET